MYNDGSKCNDDFFDMLTSLPPTEKQLRLIEQMSEHFGEDVIIPETRNGAQTILQDYFQRRERERHASA